MGTIKINSPKKGKKGILKVTPKTKVDGKGAGKRKGWA